MKKYLVTYITQQGIQKTITVEETSPAKAKGLVLFTVFDSLSVTNVEEIS